MSKRVVLSSLFAVVAVGGVAAGSLAMASTGTGPTMENSSARYIAPSGSSTGTGSVTFTSDVSDDSGIRDLKVLLWPTSSKLDPTEADMRHVEGATCARVSDETSRCTYELKVTKEEAAALNPGAWHVSALATAKDGDTLFLPSVTTFEVTP